MEFIKYEFDRFPYILVSHLLTCPKNALQIRELGYVALFLPFTNNNVKNIVTIYESYNWKQNHHNLNCRPHLHKANCIT